MKRTLASPRVQVVLRQRHRTADRQLLRLHIRRSRCGCRNLHVCHPRRRRLDVHWVRQCEDRPRGACWGHLWQAGAALRFGRGYHRSPSCAPFPRLSFNRGNDDDDINCPQNTATIRSFTYTVDLLPNTYYWLATAPLLSTNLVASIRLNLTARAVSTVGGWAMPTDIPTASLPYTSALINVRAVGVPALVLCRGRCSGSCHYGVVLAHPLLTHRLSWAVFTWHPISPTAPPPHPPTHSRMCPCPTCSPPPAPLGATHRGCSAGNQEPATRAHWWPAAAAQHRVSGQATNCSAAS